jgi:hypothetical protein
MKRVLILALLAVAGLALPAAAAAKELSVTVCGSQRCRTTPNTVSGIATFGPAVPAPRTGRFYTIALRIGGDGRRPEWKVAYDARRGIVRAADPGARSFLRRGWWRLAADVRPHFTRAVRGLEPMRRPPPHAG